MCRGCTIMACHTRLADVIHYESTVYTILIIQRVCMLKESSGNQTQSS